MRYQQVWLCVVTLLSAFAIASPLPSFADIERRWSQGESEKQIHAKHAIRDASPAFLLDREAEAEASEFSYSPDRRTLEAQHSKRDDGPGYKALKKFVNDFMKKEGKAPVVTKRSTMDEAPVLKPKKSMRYYFSA